MIRSIGSNVVGKQANALVPSFVSALAVEDEREIRLSLFCRNDLLGNRAVHFFNKQCGKLDAFGLRLCDVNVAVLERLIPPLPLAIPSVGFAAGGGAVHDDRLHGLDIPSRCFRCLFILDLAPELPGAHRRKDHRHLAVVQGKLGAVWKVDVPCKNRLWTPIQRIFPRKDAGTV